jgi:ribonuclease P protein component
LLPKSHRIHKDAQFKQIFNSGKVVYSEYFSINFDFPALATSESAREIKKQLYPQVAVVTSKKVSNKAHIRNKLRRQIYSIVRETDTYRDRKPIQMIIVCKQRILDLDFASLRDELEKLLAKIRFPDQN